MSTSPHNTGLWVDVVFIQDCRDDAEVPPLDDLDALAEYLAQWDYGQETDDAHTYQPHPASRYGSDPGDEDGLIRYPWGAIDDVHRVTVGGLDYILTVNADLGYASLSRRPLSTLATA